MLKYSMYTPCSKDFDVSVLQPVAFGVSSNLILQSQSHWSLSNGTWQKRRRKLDNRWVFEIGEMTLQMQ